MRISFRTQLFVAAVSASIVGLVVAGVLVAESMRSRIDAGIERTLVAETKLAAELLARSIPTSSVRELDEEADRIGERIGARVTLIAVDGTVVGDSAETLAGVAAMENHAGRPEVTAARDTGLGEARRYSATLKIEMLYVAVPVTHPAVAFVRLALPLTDVRQQLQSVVNVTLIALGVALAAALTLAWTFSRRIGRRVQRIADVARRYRSGDLTPPRVDYGDDELGTVAAALDESVQTLGRQLAELARGRARMEAILAGMVEGVIVVDAQGRLQLANDAARRMLRIDDFPAGHHYVEAIRHPAVVELVTAALAGTLPASLQLSPPRDPSRTLVARAAPATSDGAHGAVLVLHDITDLKRADQIRRDFVANVSHELRTPLTAIRGYLEMLSDADTSTDESRRFLGVIERHALRMERLVKDLLRLARLDAGQETLEIGACDVRGLAQGVAAELASALEERRQRVEISIGPGAEVLRADPAKMHDVLRNLVANATTYAPEGSAIQIGAQGEGSSVAVTVCDSGPGIPADDLQRVFERFYRVDKSRQRDPGGTGLGLAIVKHLVELHGGQVRAENRAEGGAKFTVTLPA